MLWGLFCPGDPLVMRPVPGRRSGRRDTVGTRPVRKGSCPPASASRCVLPAPLRLSLSLSTPVTCSRVCKPVAFEWKAPARTPDLSSQGSADAAAAKPPPGGPTDPSSSASPNQNSPSSAFLALRLWD